MKYFVFDLDGTVVDSLSGYFEIMKNIFCRDFTLDEKREMVISNPFELLSRKLPKQKVAEAIRILNDRNDAYLDSIRPFVDIVDSINTIKAKSGLVAIWTNRDRESTEIILKNCGLYSVIDFLVTGDCVNERKPNPEGFSMIANRFGVKEKDLVMVGDHLCDMLPAKMFDATAVKANWHNLWDDGICSSATLQFNSTSHFKAWVESTIL